MNPMKDELTGDYERASNIFLDSFRDRMWALFGTPEGATALVIGRFLHRLKKVFNIDKHTRAFPVRSSRSAPATGIFGGHPAKLLLPTSE